LLGAEVHPPFREDNAALAVDGALVERRRPRPVLEHGQGAIQYAGHIGWNPQRVLRVIVTCCGVRVWPDAQAKRPKELDDALSRKWACAFELHVFDEMGDSLLIFALEHRAGLDNQP